MSGSKRRAPVLGGAALGVALIVGQITAAGASPSAGAQQPLSASAAVSLAKNADTSVIVFMKDQPAAVRNGTAAAAARSQSIASAQAGIRGELSQVRAQRVHSYQLLNAVAATVSSGEAARLAANPAVAKVVHDGVVRGADPAAAARAAAAPAAAGLHNIPNACAPLSSPYIPEYLGVTHTQSTDPAARTARSLGYTGKGVKVAWMAEGIDVNNPEFIRPDGSHVFTDYQDFSGDGPNSPTSAGEAFLDASAIAAQGSQTYDLSKFSAASTPQPCGIKVVGMAPGAQMVGLKVFAENNATTTSGFLQAIDYAVNTDHVDVLNESFGSNPFSDTPTKDAVSQFDTMAVEAGTTVTVSTGDSGTTNTIGSPASNPRVIAAAGSTTFRGYAASGYAAARNFASTGWVSNNISSLSSGGFTQSGRQPDLLAPGDIDFAACTADAERYSGCVNFLGQPSDIEESGGTSESAPLIAGAAALVIESYRNAHDGASPSPAQVKQLLLDTAGDLGHPAYEQGAGIVDSYQAVQAAASVHDGNGSPARVGSSLLTSVNNLSATGLPGAKQSWPVRITNNGATTQTIALHGRTLGPSYDRQTNNVTLSDSTSAHFLDFGGQTTNYGTVKFHVAPGADRLDASVAWPGDPANGLNARVRMALIDPQGRYAAHSIPQGVGNYGHVDVRRPTAGTWTGIIWSRQSAVGGTTGKVLFAASSAKYAAFGSVSPKTVTLTPGHQATVTVSAALPKAAGDLSGSIVLASSGGQTSIPVGLRTLVDTGHGGSFASVLTGGNGRPGSTGQSNFYSFDVPAGQQDIDVDAALTNDPQVGLFAYLIDPNGQTLGLTANRQVTGFDSNGNALAKAIRQVSLYHANPMAGRWTVALAFAGPSAPVVGDELSQPFSGTVRFNKVDIRAALPNSASARLPAGQPVTVPVKIHNTGSAPESFFLDGRLATSTTVTVPAVQPTTGVALPLKPTTPTPLWLVPTQTDRLQVTAKATVPVQFDTGIFPGDPDIPSSVGTTATAAFRANPVTAGFWFAAPSELGPFPDGGPPPATVDLTMTAHTKQFDPAVSSSVPDLWKTGGARLFIVAPGATATLPVTITPAGTSGTVVHGTLYVDDLNVVSTAGQIPFGDELTGIPYTYTIK